LGASVRAYLVRLIENRDLVGIYVARDMDQLLFLVDECTDIDGCEYVKLPAGGIMWTSPACPIPPDRIGDSDGDEFPAIPWRGASEVGTWTQFLYEKVRGWKPLLDVPPRPRPKPETAANDN
jgi:hypothetical protein